MQKRLRFFYRYLFGRQRWRRWVNTQSLLVVVISSALLASLYMTAPLSYAEKSNRSWEIQSIAAAAESAQATPDSSEPASEEQSPMAPTRTPLPPEYLQNADQTIGITLAGAILVAIVIVGALMFMPKYEDG